MVSLKKILVVDDHFEMLEFLRSMLELSNPDYRVLGAPSAEEGLLELKRTLLRPGSSPRDPSAAQAVDLLITDARLPGMSGFELVRKVRELRPELPVLMITAYASAQGREEAGKLGVYRYFEKPLDTDSLLAAVHATLHLPAATQPVPAPTEGARANRASAPGEAAVRQPAEPRKDTGSLLSVARASDEKDGQQAADGEVKGRLQALASDTGAVQGLLVNRDGDILFHVGKKDQVAVERLARLLARSLAGSFELAAELDNSEPFAIQYLAGERADLYTANIGRRHFLALLFDGQTRRGRIGTVWVFARRAIGDLRELLTRRDIVSPHGDEAPPPDANGSAGLQKLAWAARSAASGLEEKSGKEDPTIAWPDEGEDDAGLFALIDEAGDLPPVDLDAFWEEATAGVGNLDSSGLSFEEAVARGILPPDIE